MTPNKDTTCEQPTTAQQEQQGIKDIEDVFRDNSTADKGGISTVKIHTRRRVRPSEDDVQLGKDIVYNHNL